MYLTSHRVKSKEDAEGINASIYRHGDSFVVDEEASHVPEKNPGEFVSRKVQLKPGGNDVRSYLDIVAADSTTAEEIQRVYEVFEQDLIERRNPTVFRLDDVVIRLGLEDELMPMRRDELKTLYRVAMELYHEARDRLVT